MDGSIDLKPDIECYAIMEKQAETILNNWVDYVNAKDLDALLAMYSGSAVLLPTFSSEVRNDIDGIRRYFIKLAQSEKIEVTIHEDSKAVQQLTSQLYCLVGLYTWQIQYSGAQKTFVARYTFIVDAAAERPILHHHSSLLPDS